MVGSQRLVLFRFSLQGVFTVATICHKVMASDSIEIARCKRPKVVLGNLDAYRF